MAEEIIVVSGLPRSGTSLMMKMLEAGGVPIITDGIRKPDVDNPEGYYEFEVVKSLDKDSDRGWLAGAQGHAVKIVSALLIHLPTQYHYRVLLMRRNIHEVLASQRQMLQRTNIMDDVSSVSQMEEIYTKHTNNVRRWLSERPNFAMMEVDYNRLVMGNIDASLNDIAHFLQMPLDIDGMRRAINVSLYRNRVSQ